MLYHQKPKNFPLDMQVSEGIIEFEWKILLVQRAEHCSSPGTWSGPGGKLEKWESHDTALIREQFYRISCEEKPEIILNDEHQDYKWVSPEEAILMNFTEDFDTIVKEIYWL